MFEHIVIGKGLIGSATTRYLTEVSERVAVIGPDEPANWAEHKGVFASHYDQGRITRISDQDLVWAELAAKSIAAYKKLERESGISFHAAAGCVNMGLATKDSLFEKAIRTAQTLSVSFEHLDSKSARQALPMLTFPEGREVLLERGEAGFVNPRSLVAAQLAVAKRRAEVITEEVQRIVVQANHVDLVTVLGETYQAKKVLIAAGAYTNTLLAKPLSFTVKPRSIILAEVEGEELERLKAMPSIIFYEGLETPELSGVYGLPPIKYPDGKVYVKLGGRMTDLRPLSSKTELLDWFHSEGSKREVELLTDTLFSLIPNLKAKSLLSRPCVVTATAHERPYIDELIPNQVYVAAGGNGAAAKSSNEIGRLAAAMLMGNSPSQVFSAVME